MIYKKIYNRTVPVSFFGVALVLGVFAGVIFHYTNVDDKTGELIIMMCICSFGAGFICSIGCYAYDAKEEIKIESKPEQIISDLETIIKKHK